MKVKVFYSFLFFIVFFNTLSQPAEPRMSTEEYINKYKDFAIKEMLEHKIPASITLAQGILESGNGNSPLAKYANNHFGIKCHNDWNGATFYVDDDKKNECFRKYYSPYESFRDHSLFLVNRDRYEPLFKLKITDYIAWAKGLKKLGYATNPNYDKQLIYLIEKYELYRFDKIKEMPTSSIAKNDNDFSNFKNVKKNQHITQYHNRIKYIIAKKGDTFFSIAKEFNMALWQIYKYNDLNKTDILRPGDIIYLQPKRRKAKDEYHIVKKGETMHYISQKYGIKLRVLYKKNNMIPGTEPEIGQKIYLRKRIKS